MDILNLIVGLFMIGIGFLVKSAPDLMDGHLVKAIDVHTSFLAALSYFYSTVLTTKKYLNNE